MHNSRTRTRVTGPAFIAFAVSFNAAFAWLGATFDYPDILRRPAGEVLTRFEAGGSLLIVQWYLFALTAAAFLPIVWAVHAATPAEYRSRDIARSIGTLAVMAQVFGLLRWTITVPMLAAAYVDPATSGAAREAIVWQFSTLHQFAGVAIGEHLGQSATAAWLLLVAAAQRREPHGGRRQAVLATLAALLILVGLIEGFATVLPIEVGALGLATPVGYVLLSLWLIDYGVSLFVQRKSG